MVDEKEYTDKEIMRMVDKNIAIVAKHFNVSPMDIMDGDYHYYMHQYNLSVEDEVFESQPHREKVDSLFDAF